MDDVCLAYAPNAHALRAARETSVRIQPDRLFSVDEPQPVSAKPLPNSAQEVMAACEHFTHRRVLGGEAATGLPILVFYDQSGELIIKGLPQEFVSRLQESGGSPKILLSPKV